MSKVDKKRKKQRETFMKQYNKNREKIRKLEEKEKELKKLMKLERRKAGSLIDELAIKD